MDDELYLDNLSEFIENNKIVTYKFLATMLDVHVNTSKQMLYTFYNREKKKGKKVCGTYFLSGFAPANIFKSSKDEEPMEQDDDMGSGLHDEHFILLCGCDKLEETKSKFTKLLSVHLYAVSSTPIEDFQSIKNCSPETSNEDKPCKKVFKSLPTEEYFNKTRKPIQTVEVKKSPPPVKTEKKDKDKSLPSDHHEKKPEPHRNLFTTFGSTDKDKAGKSASKSKKPEKKTKATQQKISFKPCPDEKYAIKASPPPSPKRKIKVESKSDDEDFQKRTQSPPPSKNRKTYGKKAPPPKRQSNVIESESDSDNSGASESPPPKNRRLLDEVENSPPPKRKAKVIESASEDDDDSCEFVPSPPKQAKKEEKPAVPGKKHVTKLKQVTYEDADGYMVTKTEKVVVSEPEDDDIVEEPKVVNGTPPVVPVKKEIINNNPEKKKSGDVIPPKSSKSTSESDGATKKKPAPKKSSKAKGTPSIVNFFQKK